MTAESAAARSAAYREPPGLPRFLDTLATAAALELPERTVRSLFERGVIPGARKVGGRWRITDADLLAWLEDEPVEVEVRTRGTADVRRREINAIHLRAADDAGEITGYATTWNATYAVGGGLHEQVLRGAFSESIAARARFPLLYGHAWGEPPIGDCAVSEDGKGLRFEGKLYMNTERARAAFEAARSGGVSGTSIGFIPTVVRNANKNGKRIEEIVKAKLLEISLVVSPANEDAQLVSVRSAPPPVADAVRQRLTAQRIANIVGPGGGSSPGARLAAAPDLRVLQDRGRGRVQVAGPPLDDLLRLRDVTFAPQRGDAPLLGAPRPGPTPFLNRVEVVPVDRSMIPFWTETSTTASEAAVAPYGTALPEADEVFAAPDLQLQRFGIATPVSQSLFDYKPVLSRFIDRVLVRNYRLSLERELLSGPDLLGILTLADVDSEAPGTDRLGAILSAVETLSARGYGPLVAVVNPADLRAMREGAEVHRFADVVASTEELEGIFASVGVPAGKSVVGDVRNGANLVTRGSTSVEASNEHADFFTRGFVQLRIQAEVELAADTSAFIKVEAAA